MPARLAVDIGGTFTDVVLEHPNGSRVTTKLLTTYAHPGEAVLAGIDQVLTEAGLSPADIGLIIHGTTLATNALIERRGARTALLTTAGHRDALEMAHEDRFEQYDINIDRPAPLVPRYLRIGIRERMNHRGEILLPLNEADLDQALAVIDEHRIESVAIGYLHAYVNAQHEQRSADFLHAARPDLAITQASAVCPEIREFERLSTACANAYVQPLMARYLQRLDGELQQRGFTCAMLLMTSGGGLTTVETAARFPIRLVESGPAGGAILAAHVAEQLDMPRLLSFDMGGTTAKLCMIDDAQPVSSRSFEVDRVYRFRKGSGLPVRIPVIEMVEIGAGGGSLACVDKLGRLQVGPESAGSEPGPAAFGRGGSRPAVTDADLQLGRIIADGFAGGRFTLDAAAAGTALMEWVGKPLQLNLDAAACGISEVVDETMAAAARAHAAEFGIDLSARDMVAFGGAAPLHATRLGEKLGVRRIVVPSSAGVGSALGFLLAPVAYEVVRSEHQFLADPDPARLNELMAQMRAEAETVVRQAAPRDELTETRQAYMRYCGQGHEIAVSLPTQPFGEDAGDVLQQAFNTAYKKLYGRTIAGVATEALSWTLALSAQRPDAIAGAAEAAASTDAPQAFAQQSLLDVATAQRGDAAVYARDQLLPGQVLIGPALISEAQTTTVVAAGWQACVDARGWLILTREANRNG